MRGCFSDAGVLGYPVMTLPEPANRFGLLLLFALLQRLWTICCGSLLLSILSFECRAVDER